MFNRYRELGFSVFPLIFAAKNPRAECTGWQRYCLELPSEEDCKRWDISYPDGNWGLALGPASGLCVVDIDEPEFLDCVPESPIIRGGKPGRQQRFFRYSEDVRAQKIKKSSVAPPSIEILSLGNYTVIPPSIHPDTRQPFFWISDVNLETLDLEKIPFLKPEQIAAMRARIEGSHYVPKSETLGIGQVFFNDDPQRQAPHGSHDRLKFIASKLIANQTSLENGVAQLLDYDFKFHKPCGYFFEQGRTTDSASDPYSNAAKFYSNLLAHINRERQRKGETPLIPSTKSIAKEISREISQETINYPSPEGIMKTFIDYCSLSAATTSTRQLGLGGALSLMSVLAANRVWARCDQFLITPNIYVLNLAPSGAGKEATQKFITDLIKGKGLLGASTYRSGSALLQNLPSQQNRIDIIDEASGFFKAMGDKNNFQSEMAEILCHLFSKASTEFGGVMAATKGKEPVGACFQPHVTLFASTTPAGFRCAVNKELATKGLLPRFLTFYERQRGSINFNFNEAAAEALKRSVKDFIDAFLLRYPLSEYASNRSEIVAHYQSGFQAADRGKIYKPIIFQFSNEAKTIWHSYRTAIFEKVNSSEESFDEAFKNRFAELAAKCALLHALSAHRESIEAQDVRWGIDVVDLQWVNCEDIYELTRAESYSHENAILIKNVIKQQGGSLDKAKLTKLTHRLGKRHREEALAELMDSNEIIFEVKDPGTNKSRVVYHTVGPVENSDFTTSTSS